MMDDESIRLFKRGRRLLRADAVDGERLSGADRANPNAYPPEVRAKIDWRIGITGKALRKAVPRA
jgi:hypothetical protein